MTQRIRTALGFGVRVLAGLPMRIDVAWPINRDPRDDGLEREAMALHDLRIRLLTG